MTLRRKGFTLVEMLVVIMIIALLAAALFPAIASALDSARATAAKSKGRGIWAAIAAANAEREPLGLTDLWPGDIITNSNTSTQYFLYLMSDGSVAISAGPSLASSPNSQLVSDLQPSALFISGGGLSTAPGGTGANAFGAVNNAWSVFMVNETADAGAPLLITRNVNFASGTGNAASSNTVTTLDTSLILKRAIWVSRGGGTFDARQKYLSNPSQPIIPGTNSYVWVTP